MTILDNPIPVSQLSSSLSGSLKRLLPSTKSLSAALPRRWYCTNLWIDLHESANLKYNLYCTCNPWHMDQDWKIERWEAEYVYTHIHVADHLFRSSHSHQMVQVAFWAKVAPILVKVDLCLCVSSGSVNSLLCHFGKEGSHLFDFDEPLPGVILLQASSCSTQETQHPASSLLRLRQEVS